MANKAAGKGYETTDNYSNMQFDFFNIHNIHIMRDSLQKMFEGVFPRLTNHTRMVHLNVVYM